jgi:hypothetical protein
MRLRAPFAIVAGAVALRLALGVGFVNYDTLYSLAWGQQLARGQTPSYGLALAPTPHPLLELLGVVLAPLGAAATIAVVVALAYLALAALGYLVFALGAAWFGWPAGLAAAALILSRYEVLSYGARSYADVPYIVLVLCALLIETRCRRAGWPVIATLDLAGLLRPEAWLFAALYWLYLWRGSSPRERATLAALVAAAPLLWAASDLAVTGNPLWSLTNTRTTATKLHRVTGLVNVPYTGGRRLGEVLGPDGVIAAALGGALALWLVRSRAALGAAVALVAVLALALVATAGLPIQDRYVFLIASLGAVFGGAGLFGWLVLERPHPRRRLWQGAAAVIALAVLAAVAWDVPRFHKTFNSTRPADQSLDAQQRIASDLVALTRDHAITTSCLPISVPYATPVPLLALYLHTSPANVSVGAIAHGTYLLARDHAVYLQYELDPNDPRRQGGRPAGSRLVAANRSWYVYETCRGPEGPR